MKNNDIKDKFGLKELEIGNAYADWIFALISPHIGSRVMEIGSGLGLMIERLKEKELVIASDINMDFLNRIRKKLSENKNIKYVYLDVTKITPFLLQDLRKNRIDTVITLNTLEHIKEDEKALKNIYDLLPMNGKVSIFVPAVPFIYGSFDRSLGHYRRYSKKELYQKLNKAGFEIIDYKYFNFVGLFWWFLAGKVFRIRTIPGNTGKLLNIIVPVLRKIESILKLPIGQSIVIIGEKKS